MKGPFFAERDMCYSKIPTAGYGAVYDESLSCETWCFQISQYQNANCQTAFSYLLLRLTISASVRLLLRVLYPRVGCPHGVTGWRPPEVLPSPPPWGWSTGFIDTPRLEGLMPFQRLRPALPIETFSWSVLPTWPMVAMHSTKTSRVSPEGSFSSA